MTAVIPDSPRPARPKKASGQWALGYREPLNANERMKKDDDGLNVRARVERIYSVRGFDSIPGDDLRGRLRWWGLYTQRKPGIDGGRRQDRAQAEHPDDRSQRQDQGRAGQA